jgi:two-component system response regulator
MNLNPILLVEDNPDDEELTLRAFRKNRIANPVVVARDGAEALECLVGEKAMPYALVLLDLRLPKVHGLDVLQKLREDPTGKMTPVVILTSSNEDSDLLRGYSLGVNSYVRKPVDFQEFVGAVAQLGMYWLMLNQVPTPAAVQKVHP